MATTQTKKGWATAAEALTNRLSHIQVGITLFTRRVQRPKPCFRDDEPVRRARVMILG
jgi:hypothetical protein